MLPEGVSLDGVLPIKTTDSEVSPERGDLFGDLPPQFADLLSKWSELSRADKDSFLNLVKEC